MKPIHEHNDLVKKNGNLPRKFFILLKKRVTKGKWVTRCVSKICHCGYVYCTLFIYIFYHSEITVEKKVTADFKSKKLAFVDIK